MRDSSHAHPAAASILAHTQPHPQLLVAPRTTQHGGGSGVPPSQTIAAQCECTIKLRAQSLLSSDSSSRDASEHTAGGHGMKTPPGDPATPERLPRSLRHTLGRPCRLLPAADNVVVHTRQEKCYNTRHGTTARAACMPHTSQSRPGPHNPQGRQADTVTRTAQNTNKAPDEGGCVDSVHMSYTSQTKTRPWPTLHTLQLAWG